MATICLKSKNGVGLTNILTVNSGSSSLKLSLFKNTEKGIERTAEKHIKGLSSAPVDDLQEMIEAFMKEHHSKPEIVGHRVVHGGPNFTHAIAINSQKLSQLEKLNELAPLHNPSCISGIKACQKLYPKIPQTASFDTAFHHHIPQYAKVYGIDYRLAEKYSIQRYGFHGLSNAFIWEAYKHHTKRLEGNIITLHLGNGCSMTAIKDGISLDTSMGMTPLEGLIMSTRSGDIDASIVELLCQKEKKSPQDVLQDLNKKSGLLGLSGKTSDMKELLEASSTDTQCKLAVEAFVYRASKYLGAYTLVLGKLDGVVFTGGIGENSSEIRRQILDKAASIGLKANNEANEQLKVDLGTIHSIHSKDSIPIYVVGTDENAFIAYEALQLM